MGWLIEVATILQLALFFGLLMLAVYFGFMAWNVLNANASEYDLYAKKTESVGNAILGRVNPWKSESDDEWEPFVSRGLSYNPTSDEWKVMGRLSDEAIRSITK